MRPLTDDRPKALVEVLGESILSRAARALLAHGVEHLVIATGYRADAIASRLADLSVRVTLCPNPRYDSTQNVASFALCADAIAGEGFFKLDGDVLFTPELLSRLDACPAALAVAVDSKRRLDEEAMKVEEEGGRIRRFGKGLSLAASGGESIGIERVSASASKALLDALCQACEEGRTDLYYEDVYDELVRSGALHAQAVEVGDLPWTEVDDHADLANAEALFAQVDARTP